jgi:nucleoside-diphosphate-sugar epimerase
MRILVLGCGYIGTPLIQKLAELGHKVHAARRSPLSLEGIITHQVDVTQRGSFDSLPHGFDWVFLTASSSRGDAAVHRAVFVDGATNLVNWLGNSTARVLFTSSTNVYPQMDGKWVDESSLEKPVTRTALNLVEAENVLMESDIPCSILRVAGIYGPERGYLYRRFINDEAVLIDKGKRWMNMIHRDDVVGAILTAMNTGPGIYNAVDNEPVTQRHFFEWLARELEKPMPPEGESIAPKREATNKRVRNDKLKAKGWALRYPTFREGYQALISKEQKGI